MGLKIYNSLTKSKEKFTPVKTDVVRIYNCGPTVYDYFHIGNARNFITAETVRRYLAYKGYKVKFIQNVTDIEDKIINKAKETGVTPSDVAEKFTKAYFEDLEKLGIKPADISPKATEHIEDIIEFVQELIDKGYAYEVDGDVYFEVAKFKEYGKLSGQKIEDTIAGARVEADDRKKHPADFNLWKSSKPGETGWPSPWGMGRPGWHIECSVMSSKYLGETFDIHLGGNDLIFPHHENEIAQSEALTGKPLAKYWMHNGMLQMTGDKMSKSLGNIKNVRDLLEDYEPDVIRFYLLSSHYRGPLELTNDSLDEAKKALQRLWNCSDMTSRLGDSQSQVMEHKLNESEKMLSEEIDKAIDKFEESMDDDFNTSGAVGAIFELVAEANKFAGENPSPSDQGKAVLGKVNKTLNELCQILGINANKESSIAEDDSFVNDLLQLIVNIRQDARKNKNWDTADKIRDGLSELGVKLEDTRDGVVWKIDR
ncbi:cysteine--tRNA ligase [Candidatus Poribacteria bacterium]|nr:cysteine--tRNA ligase [Candidatus Poribacteria bacterium]